VSIADEINFNIFVNFGSFIAIIIFYRLFLKDLIIDTWNYVFKKDQKGKDSFLYIIYVIIATIPAGIAGYLLKDIIDDKLSSLLSVGICLFITGLLLLFISSVAKYANTEKISLKTSIMMGFAQVIGLLPGISRSGSTTSLAVLNKVDLEKGLRFSFMMYIPISVGSLVLGIADLDAATTYIPGYIGAFVISGIATFIAINLFFKLVKKSNLKYFGIYCLTIASAVLIYLAVTK
jgi:undecaprenyl-diphosphatase